jgi:hypothetical protein
MGISSVHLLPLSYNVIDADHVDEDEEVPKATVAKPKPVKGGKVPDLTL